MLLIAVSEDFATVMTISDYRRSVKDLSQFLLRCLVFLLSFLLIKESDPEALVATSDVIVVSETGLV